MRRVLIKVDLPEEYVNKLRKDHPGFEFTVCTDNEEFPGYLKDAEVLVVFFRCSKETVDMAPNLKWIQGLSAGVDKMPLEEIERRGIILTNGRGVHKIHMAEYAIAAMIYLARNFHMMFRNQLEHKWDKSVPQDEIYGSTLGILGLGSIGMEISKRASLFGMHVIGVKSSPKPVEYVEKVYGADQMDEVFKQSDYIINLLPSTNETNKIIDKHYFNLMKETACLINMGRGTTVNEPDLIEALKHKKFRAMVTDVFYEEPLPQDSPLWDLDNVILTPHICGESPKYMNRVMEIIEHNFNVYDSGKGTMINLVDPARGY